MSGRRDRPPMRIGGDDGNKPTDDDGPKLSQQVLDAVLSGDHPIELFRDERGRECARIKIHVAGARYRSEAVAIRSGAMLKWVSARAHSVMNRPVGRATLDEARLILEGMAMSRPKRQTFLRVAEHDRATYLDLGDDSGDAIRITARGWEIVQSLPDEVLFRRPEAMRAMFRPEPGGSLDDLEPFVNIASAPVGEEQFPDDGLLLLAAWMIGCWRIGRPYCVLGVHGRMGSAKSTTARMVKSLIDPNAAPLRALPRDVEDIVVTALHSHMLVWDNQSGLSRDTSDTLCRLSTGGGIASRKKYSDDEESVCEAIRPLILNGIEDVANRDDLADRCVLIFTKPISPKQRLTEEVLFERFNAAGPLILGALLDGLAAALRNIGMVQLEKLPRMADFFKWISAAETGLRRHGRELEPGTLTDAFMRNIARTHASAIESSPVCEALVTFMAGKDSWSGEPELLRRSLGEHVDQGTQREKWWPKSAQALSSTLRKKLVNLERGAGLKLDLDGYAGPKDNRRRVWMVTRAAPGHANGADPTPIDSDNGEPPPGLFDGFEEETRQ